jgi:hypothetical protein
VHPDPATSHQPPMDPVRILLFSSLAFKSKHKTNLTKNFLHITFEGTFTLFFKDKKSKRSQKTVDKVFLTIFALGKKDPDPDPYL